MIKIEVLKPVGPYKAGQTVKVETDQKGIPTDRFWRRRLQDDDGFCRVIPEPAPVKKTKASPNSQTEE